MRSINKIYKTFFFTWLIFFASFSIHGQEDVEKQIQEKIVDKQEDKEVVVKESENLDSLFKKRFFKKIINVLTKKGEKENLTYREYILLSRSYGRVQNFGNGYVLAEEMIQKAQEEKDTANLLEGLNLKAEHITDLRQIDKGVKFCDSITPFFRKKDSVLFMSLCFKCGVLYKYDNQLEKAYNSYKKITLKKYRKLSIFKNNFAIILMDLKKYDEAITYLNESIKLNKKEDLSPVVQYSNIASIYLRTKKYDKVKVFLDSAYNALNQNSRQSTKKTIFDNYFTLFRLQGAEEEAFKFLDSIYIVNENLLNKRIEERLQSIEVANERENRLIKKVKYVGDELTTTKKNILQGTLFLLFLVFGLILLFFFFKYRGIQTSYKKVLINQKIGQIKLNPDSISHSLQVMQNMIETKNTKTVIFISRFSKLLRSVLESSRKTLISISEEKNILKHYLQVQELENESKFTYSINIDSELEFLNLLIPPMLIQTYLKHSLKRVDKEKDEGLNLKIDFIFKNDELSCVIKNNFKRNEAFNKLMDEEIEKTNEVLKIFSKKLNVPSSITINFHDEDDVHETNINIILPYKLNSDD